MAGSKATRLASLLLLTICCCPGAFSNEVTTTTPKQSVKENASVNLICTMSSNFVNPVVKWRFVDKEGSSKLMFYDGKITDSYKDRLTYNRPSVRFSSVTRKDTGQYICDVLNKDLELYGEVKMELIVEVPPSTPVMIVPTSVTTGSMTELHCTESVGSPPPVISWYKDKLQMPADPKSNPKFINSTYTIDAKTGVLTINPTTKDDAGEYYCEASNLLGRTVSTPVKMEVSDTNVGGIVAAVIIVLLILALIGVGLWYAYSRGYIGKQSSTGKKVIYSTPSETKSDRNFQQTSSFLV